MPPDDLGPDASRRLEEVIGYLNFSSGTTDPRFLSNLNALFGLLEARRPGDAVGPPPAEPTWRVLGRVIRASIDRLRGTSQAFRQLDQAEAVVGLTFDEVLPAYRRHHRDLLFHQTDESLFLPLFIGRVCEAVLLEGGPWQQSQRIVEGALQRLNDFVGHRPVAVLETGQKLQPYAHEWVRPIPLYIAGAGVTVGRYHDLIAGALAILRSTDPALLDRAWFDLALLDELALDPRAFDFDHPVNRRPNYHFGGWDPHHIDEEGRYRRFVLQPVTLDALLSRIDGHGDLPRDELLFEAAAVLGCTMMMGSGITGSGPGSHDSSTTLATLLPIIAEYRDAFYEQLLPRLPGAHAGRLRSEAHSLRQPFGGARQHLNQALARRRAEQLQHVHLARLFARMGNVEAAARQSQVVPVAAARMRCEIDCRLSTAHLEIDRGRLDSAHQRLPEIEDLLDRAIQCGAIVDPWNILGFAGQYRLFPAVENSVPDHRVDELIELIEEVFALYARLEKEAAAAGRPDLQRGLSDGLHRLAQWWDRFASTEVSSVQGISGRQAWESAGQVAGAMAAWREAGTSAGDIAFWRRHAQRFRSPKAFAMPVETLVDRCDLVAAMALLMVWLNQADQIPLAEGDYSFYDLAIRWMEKLWQIGQPDQPAGTPAASPAIGPAERASRAKTPSSATSQPGVAEDGPDRPQERWLLTKKFFDYLEANADHYWEAPRLELVSQPSQNGPGDGDEREDASEGLFDAAYENITYRDTTDDGFEGEMIEGGIPVTDFELSMEAERISWRLAFLATLARLWKTAAAACGAAGGLGISGHRDFGQENRARESVVLRNPPIPESPNPQIPESPVPDAQPPIPSALSADQAVGETLTNWARQASENRRGLVDLLVAVHRYSIPPPRGTVEAMIEYDRRRAIKEALLERTLAACVETADAVRFIRAIIPPGEPAAALEGWERAHERVLRAVLRGDVDAVRAAWPELTEALRRQPLLYVPTSRGGDPRRIVASRSLQRVLRRLLAYLPRLGLLSQTFQLLQTIQQMERDHPVGPGAITEFDRLFEIGCKGIVRCLVISSEGAPGVERGKTPAPPGPGRRSAPPPATGRGRWSARSLVECVEVTIEPLLRLWLSHSRNIRVAAAEAFSDARRWRRLKKFIRKYGHDLFTQTFMNFGGLRAILDRGVDAYLEALEQEPEGAPALVLDLDRRLPRDEAAGLLQLAVEAVVENYSEYVDYNSTTTQSDRGGMLYTLLDFLRLKASYERTAWNLRPVTLAHEVLVRCGRKRASGIWREAVAERSAALADDLLKQFDELSRKYGMRLRSIADRLEGRFVRPLAVDRLCALVRPAAEQLRGRRRSASLDSLEQLEEEVTRFTQQPSGVGFDVPSWLEALEAEVERSAPGDREEDEPTDPFLHVAQVRLSLDELLRQVETWTEPKPEQ